MESWRVSDWAAAGRTFSLADAMGCRIIPGPCCRFSPELGVEHDRVMKSAGGVDCDAATATPCSVTGSQQPRESIERKV